MKYKLMTVICPVRNEQDYIESIIQFFLNSSPQDKELIIVDGQSNDRTRDIILKYVAENKNIRLLDNPDFTVPYALNKAINASDGDPVVRLDAHSIYDPEYFNKILETFERTGAEIVGGPMRAIGKTDFQKAVAFCTSTKFGIGDSQFHNENYEGFVDSVYLGAWRRSIFEMTGLFDEQMTRNQDDEFHYRAKKLGMKIYLNPAIKSFYYPRNNFLTLSKQYFQYGLFKPLVLKKVRSGMKIRHLVPGVFVLYCIVTPILYKLISPFFIFPFILYALFDFCFSFLNKNEMKIKLYSLLIYPVLHVSYGAGFILGLNQKSS